MKHPFFSLFSVFLLSLLSARQLMAFELEVITPYPVLGYQELPFNTGTRPNNRTYSIWYPVSPKENGKPSASPWDVFHVAAGAPIVTSKEKRAMIVLSHGYTGNAHNLSWLIRGLVYQGFIVIGIQHLDLIDGKVHINHWKRAEDIASMITQFSRSTIADSANLDQIGIAGFSLGGTTGIWIAGGRSTKLTTLIPGPDYAPPKDYVKAEEALPTLNKYMMAKDWRDNRVKAAFIMAPAWAWLFDEESLQAITIPTYIIAFEGDKVLVTKNNAGYFAKMIPKAFYQEILGKGDHYIFVSLLDNDQRKKADPSNELAYLFKDDTSVDRRWIQMQVIEKAVRFFRSVFKPQS